MTASDSAAFAEYAAAEGNPGSISMMELRYGGQGSTHALLISAANATELKEYLDELPASDDCRDFNAKVSGNRKMNNVSMLRRVASYGE